MKRPALLPLFLVFASFSGLVDAQQRLVAKPPREAPEAIVTRILASYRDGAPIPPDRMPLVPRLSDQLRRTDLGFDPIAEPDGRPICCIVIDAAHVSGDKRVSVSGSFRHGADQRALTFDFDVTSGDWFITEIRAEGGRPSLRQLLRLNR